ncbi:MAG: hypothetical protein IPK71_10360 [Myxococcales bacterium]|nr:hypothetical protein [Myxococcales bacterium]
MSRARWVRAALLALALRSLGCTSDVPPAESASEPFDGLKMLVSARSNGSLLAIDVGLRSASSVDLVVSPSESLTVDAPGSPTTALVPSGNRAIAAVATEGSVALVHHRRAEGSRTVRVELPRPFVIDAPKSVRRGEPLALRWEADPTTAPLIEMESGCLTGPAVRRPARDLGEYTFAPADLPSRSGPCTLTVRISRTREAADGPDAIRVAQIRTVLVEISP